MERGVGMILVKNIQYTLYSDTPLFMGEKKIKFYFLFFNNPQI